MRNLINGPILAGVDVEPDRGSPLAPNPSTLTNRPRRTNSPIRLVVHSSHIPLLDHAVLFGEIGFGERLRWERQLCSQAHGFLGWRYARGEARLTVSLEDSPIFLPMS